MLDIRDKISRPERGGFFGVGIGKINTRGKIFCKTS